MGEVGSIKESIRSIVQLSEMGRAREQIKTVLAKIELVEKENEELRLKLAKTQTPMNRGQNADAPRDG